MGTGPITALLAPGKAEVNRFLDPRGNTLLSNTVISPCNTKPFLKMNKSKYLQKTSILTTLWWPCLLREDIGICKAISVWLTLAKNKKKVFYSLCRNTYQYRQFVNSCHYLRIRTKGDRRIHRYVGTN